MNTILKCHHIKCKIAKNKSRILTHQNGQENTIYSAILTNATARKEELVLSFMFRPEFQKLRPREMFSCGLQNHKNFKLSFFVINKNTTKVWHISSLKFTRDYFTIHNSISHLIQNFISGLKRTAYFLNNQQAQNKLKCHK